MNNTPIPQYDILYRFALDCAEHKIRGNCDFLCKQCPSNVSLYSIAREDAVMLQHSAELEINHRFKLQHESRIQELEYHAIRKRERMSVDMAGIKSILYTAILTILCLILIQKCSTVKPQNTEQNRKVAIISTLRAIEQRDADGDGLIDCVDYAIQFYELYPDKSRVRIIWNKNKPVGMNHLFVMVDGVPIEPAVYINPRADFYRMDKYYPTKYNPIYDRDVTANIDSIRNNNYRWIW